MHARFPFLVPFSAPIAAVLTAAALSSSCHDDDDGGGSVAGANAVPTVQVNEPAADVELEEGEGLLVAWVDDDPDDVAATTVVAVALDPANPRGGSGEIVIVLDAPEQGGELQEVVWDTVGVPPGRYRIEARTRDEETTAVASAAGTVTVLEGEPPGPVPVLSAPLLASEHNESATDVDAAADGSYAVTGNWQSATTFYPGTSSALDLTGQIGISAFVARYASDGEILWVRAPEWDGSGIAFDTLHQGIAVATLDDGTVYAAGTFRGGILFGAGEPTELAFPAAPAAFQTTRIWLARFEADGSFGWATRIDHPIGTGGNHDLRALGAASDGSVVLCGEYSGTAVFPGTGVTFPVSNRRPFLARYDAAGVLQWAKPVVTSLDPNSASGLDVSADGSSVFAGFVFGEMAVVDDPSGAIVGQPGTETGLVVRYSPAGAVEWVRQLLTIAPQDTNARATDVSAFPDGSCVVEGLHQAAGGIALEDGLGGLVVLPRITAQDMLLARYRGDGELLWARTTGGLLSGTGRRLATNGDGSFVRTGTGGGDFDVAVLPSSFVRAYVAGYGPDGETRWARSEGGLGLSPFAAAALRDGASLVVGQYSGDVVLGLDSPQPLELPHAGGSDAFGVGWDADGELLVP